VSIFFRLAMSFPHNHQWAEAVSRSLSVGPPPPAQGPIGSTVPAAPAPVLPFTSLSSVPLVGPGMYSYAVPPVMVRVGESRSPSPPPAAKSIAPAPPNRLSAFMINPPVVLGSAPPAVVTAPHPPPPIRFNPNPRPPASQPHPPALLPMCMPAQSQSSFMPSAPFFRFLGDPAAHGGSFPSSSSSDGAPQPSPIPNDLPGPQAPAAPTGAFPSLPSQPPPLTFLRPFPSPSISGPRPTTTPHAILPSRSLSEVLGATSMGSLFNFADAMKATHSLGDLSFLTDQEMSRLTTDEPTEAPGNDPVLKVAARSNIHTLAGAIANRLRSGTEVEMVAIGPDSVNQAVKAIAVARTYLEDDPIDLVALPEFLHVTGRDANQAQRSALRFIIAACPNLQPKGAIRDQRPADDPRTSQLKVAGTSTPAFTAGAIAKRIRLGGRCAAIAMGADPVNQTVKAVAIARTFLERDRMDVAFQPKFIHLSVGESQTRSGIEMVIERR